jgi:hypothetical protein
MATLNAMLDALRYPMKEAHLERHWNSLKAVANAAIGTNVTITGGRTSLGLLDLDTAADLALSVTDQKGLTITPKFSYPNSGRDRNREATPQLGGFRF